MLLYSLLLCSLVSSTFIHVQDHVYVVNKTLGTGSGATVKLITEIGSNILFALKESDKHDDALKRYQLEASILKHLIGNNRVAQIHAQDETPTLYRIVLEYGQETMRSVLNKRKKGLSIDIVSYWIQLVQCVEQLHNANVVHSDLKPDNILIVNNQLKVFDFDLSGIVSPTYPYLYKIDLDGTLEYMAPEQATLSQESIYKVGKEADIYALGGMLYELVYHKRPLQFLSSEDEQLDCLTNIDCLIRFDDVEGEEMNLLVDIIQWCLHRDPDQRPTIQDLLRANQFFTISDQVLAEKLSPETRQLEFDDVVVVGNKEYVAVQVTRNETLTAASLSKVVDIHSGQIFTLKTYSASMMNISALSNLIQTDITISMALNPSDHLIHSNDMIYASEVSILQEHSDQSFKSYLQSTTLNSTLIRLLFTQIIKSISAIHAQNVIHTAPSPSNFWSCNSVFKLTNYMHGHRIPPTDSFITSYNEPMGSPNYMSPESVTPIGENGGFELGYHTDVWVIGITFYEILFGITPFDAYKINEEKMDCISDEGCLIEWPVVTEEYKVFVEIVKFCLVRDPRKRMSVDALEKWIEDGIIPVVDQEQSDSHSSHLHSTHSSHIDDTELYISNRDQELTMDLVVPKKISLKLNNNEKKCVDSWSCDDDCEMTDSENCELDSNLLDDESSEIWSRDGEDKDEIQQSIFDDFQFSEIDYGLLNDTLASNTNITSSQPTNATTDMKKKNQATKSTNDRERSKAESVDTFIILSSIIVVFRMIL